MNGFAGHITACGSFAATGDSRARHPESHVGCDVVVRGYIADRAALVERFGLERDAGDGELVAHAFRTWGAQLQAHVHGEWAAVVWDVRTRTGLLAHDALALEPLFYTVRDGGVAFATELVELLDDETAAVLDDEYLADFFAYGGVTSERTPYRAVKRLLPGRSLRWADGELREMRTWNLADVPALRCRDDAEYEERFRALLEAGVRSSLRTAGRAGVALSGGLDSSTIACVAARAGCDVSAYSTISPRWPDGDEQSWMRMVVERYGMPWHATDVESVLPFSRLPTEFLGEPTGSVVDEERRRIHGELLASHGVTAMLHGNGGDTVLCSSPGARPPHLADELFDGKPLGALRSVAAWKRESRVSRSYTYWLLRGLVEPSLEHLRGERVRTEHVAFPSWFQRDYGETMRLERRSRRRIAPACRRPGHQVVWDDLWSSALTMSTIPRRRMRYDFRAPLLYLPLVEFMWSIPWEQKLRPRCDRYLQRRALTDVLPEPIRRRATKAGASGPYAEGLRRSRDWMAFLTDTPLMAQRGIVDAARWRDAVRKASVGQTSSDKYFFAAVAVEAWLQQLGEHRLRIARSPAAALAPAV